jgi:hypothetical protein
VRLHPQTAPFYQAAAGQYRQLGDIPGVQHHLDAVGFQEPDVAPVVGQQELPEQVRSDQRTAFAGKDRYIRAVGSTSPGEGR